MLSFYTICFSCKINVFSVYRLGDWMLLWFLYFCFLCVPRCSTSGRFPVWYFFDSKNKLCRYGIWLQTNSLSSHWFYETVCFKMLTTDKSFCLLENSLDPVSSAIVPANSCLTTGANTMTSPCIPLWNFDFNTQKLCIDKETRKSRKYYVRCKLPTNFPLRFLVLYSELDRIASFCVSSPRDRWFRVLTFGKNYLVISGCWFQKTETRCFNSYNAHKELFLCSLKHLLSSPLEKKRK